MSTLHTKLLWTSITFTFYRTLEVDPIMLILYIFKTFCLRQSFSMLQMATRWRGVLFIQILWHDKKAPLIRQKRENLHLCMAPPLYVIYGLPPPPHVIYGHPHAPGPPVIENYMVSNI